MTGKQESRFTMQLVVRDYLNANSPMIALMPNCAPYVTGLQTGIGQIQLIREIQEVNKSGLAENKNQLKASLITLAMDASRKVIAYASYINNPVLLKEVSYSESDLKRSADAVLRDSCQVIYNRAITNAASLAAYGITAATLTNLLNAINAFTISIPNPRLGVTNRKQATDQLVVLMKGVDDMLEKIDRLVEILKLTQPQFYNGYRDARKVVDTGIGSLVARGRVMDMENGEGLKGATVKFTADSTNTKQKLKNANRDGDIVKRTAKKGGFNLKSLPEGSYTVTVSKPGYKDSVVTMNVTAGEMSEVEVRMERKAGA